jgi:hypothetical protein
VNAARHPAWLAPVVGAALSAVLSSGVTAAYLRGTAPDTVAVHGDLQKTPEQRHLAALLVAPGEPFRAVDAGRPVDVQGLGSKGLDALGFQRGWMRTWRTPDKETVDSFVLQFGSSAGALAYAQGIGRAATLLVRPEPFTVAGVPASSGLADTVKDSAGHYAQVVVLHRGVTAVLLVFATKSATPGDAVVGLAQRQWAALVAT